MTPTTPTITTKTVVDEISVTGMGTFIRFFNDGTFDRPSQSPFAPHMLDEPPTGVSSKDVTISHNPTISARLYLPKFTNPDEKVPILVYFHGGAFLFESAFSQVFHGHHKTFAHEANVVVVSVEYRLAPEHPLPACYDDSWAALKWVSSHSAQNFTNAEPWLIEHGDFSRIFIGGDSAGANIVHNIAIRAGVEDLPGDVKIRGAFLSHPFFYSSYSVLSEPVKEPGQRDSMDVIWDLVYPSAAGGIDNPAVNPVGAGAPGLAGLACSKMIVCVAGKDVLRDRGVWYYESVKESGWKGKLELFEDEDEGHDFHLLKPESENTKKFIKRLVSFLQE